ncbi:MAG TPA: amidohydrolase family protein [Candidatus Cybelea sp.]|nr:amidohydrolase family protein [Candidatus Cybelea sp.]
MQYDIKIAGGTIVDGSGKPGVKGDVGIKGGKVVALGSAPGDARETIDATDRVVAPGFVDIHTHYDAQVMWDRMLTISPWHGVTTVVIGNCGFGVAPTRPSHRELIMRTLEKVEGMSIDALRLGLGEDWPFESFPEYLDALERRGTSINVGVLAGHTPIRLNVMGEDAVKRAATRDEIAAMERIVREAMEAGAVGFATSHASTHHGFGGNPVPSRLAEVSEIGTLVGAMAKSGRGVMQATIGRTLFFDQFADIARRHHVPITWTALLAGIAGPGSHRRHLDRTRQLIEVEGLNIVPQVACRPLNFDFDFNEPFVFEARPLFEPTMKTDRAGRKRIYADAAFRAAFKEDLSRENMRNSLAGWYDRTVISVSPSDRSLEERPLTEVAAERGQDPVDLALDLSLATDFATRFRCAVVNYEEHEVAELLQYPNAVVALSDAGAHASQLCDACYATYLLGHWVREKGAIGLEQAVHMLTQKPAEVMGITDRGRLAVGAPADAVVFDPKTVAAGKLRRVYDLPGGGDRLIAESSGIDAVVVNGVTIRRSGKDAVNAAGALPGRVLRGGKAA